ncbi:unnamed protein product, partial [Mesorhabditis spiculigera]
MTSEVVDLLKNIDLSEPKKLPPGKSGKPTKIATNSYRLTIAKGHAIFKYDVRIYETYVNKQGVASLKELCKQTKDDFTEQDRKAKTVFLLKLLTEKKLLPFGKLEEVVYDRAAILFSLKKYPAVNKLFDAATLKDMNYKCSEECTGVQFELKPVTEDYALTTDDAFRDGDGNIFEFLNLLTSQHAFVRTGKFIVYQSNRAFLFDPSEAGFREADCPALPDGKYLGIGCVAKTAFHGKSVGLHIKVAAILHCKVEQLESVYSPDKLIRIKDQLKGEIKALEQKHQILTQDLLFKRVTETGRRDTMKNIIRKMNMKLGGLNHYVLDTGRIIEQRNLIIGIEFTHPPPTAPGQPPAGPSVLGFSSNCSGDLHSFVGDYKFIQARAGDDRSAIDGPLKQLFKECLNRFKDSYGAMPETIWVYRNGASEGQFPVLLSKEIRLFYEVEELTGGSYLPKMVYIAVSKDHVHRFYLEGGSDKAQNVLPGTVIDTGIVSPSRNEFFLSPHKAFQGTAKAPKYTVLRNGSDINKPSYTMDQIQGTFPPLRVASECAKRGSSNYTQERIKPVHGNVDLEDIEVLNKEMVYSGRQLSKNTGTAWTYLYAVTGLEMLTIIGSTVLYIPFITVVATSGQFHKNLLRLFIFFETPETDVLLFLVSAGRVFLAIISALKMPVIVIERLFACCFIWDYEEKRRPWISYLLIYAQSLFAAAMGTFFLYAFASNPRVSMICFGGGYLVLGAVLLIVYWRLSVYTDHVLAALSSMAYGQTGYLSVRYQVEENIRVFRLMRRIVIGNAVTITVGLGIATLCWLAPRDTLRAEMGKAFCELYIAFYVASFLVVCLWAVEDWRYRFFQLLSKTIRIEPNPGCRPSGFVAVDPNLEATIYFDFYRKAW